MEPDNPIRRLRVALKLNQADFAKLVGRSHQSIGLYERGAEIPRDVIDRLKTLAAERGHADIALELSSDDWRTRHVIHPGETLISTAAPRRRKGNNAEWHDRLDRVLDSGNRLAIDAVQSNLIVFDNYVAVPKVVEPPKARRAPAPPVIPAKKSV